MENKDKIVLLINKKAKNGIKNLKLEDMYIKQWLSEENNVKCYIYYSNNLVVSFTLLSKMEFDPLKKHNNPYTLNYIYTFEDHRRKNYALKLLEHIKKNENCSAFCNNTYSEKLFEKAKYILYKNISEIALYRYP